MQCNEIQWQDQFNIGVDIIDNAHRQLFAIAHRLLQLTEREDKSRFACEESIKFLKSYTVKHFAQEEAYMESIAYPRLEIHRRIHGNFRDRAIPALERELVQSEFSNESVRLFTGMCIGWLTGHIMMEDQAISGKSRSKWGDDQSLETLTRLERAIQDAVLRILGVEIQVISEHYAGERLRELAVFQKEVETSEAVGAAGATGAPETGKLRITLAFEERLLLQTAGRMLGISFEKMDGLALSAAREVANTIANRVAGLFGVTVQQLMEAKERRLRDCNLENLFAGRFPLYSLLFDSAMGQMVFCVDKADAR